MPVFRGKRYVGSLEALEKLEGHSRYFLCEKTGMVFNNFDDFCNHQLFLRSRSFSPFTEIKEGCTYDEAKNIEDEAFEEISVLCDGLKKGITFLIKFHLQRYSIIDILYDIYHFTNKRFFIGEEILYKDRDSYKKGVVVGVKIDMVNIKYVNHENEDCQFIDSECVEYDLQVSRIGKIENVSSNRIIRDGNVVTSKLVKNFILFHTNWYLDRTQIEISKKIIEKYKISTLRWDDIFGGPVPSFPITLQKIEIPRMNNSSEDDISLSPRRKKLKKELNGICEKLKYYGVAEEVYVPYQYKLDEVDENVLSDLRELLKASEVEEKKGREDILCLDSKQPPVLNEISLPEWCSNEIFMESLSIYTFLKAFEDVLNENDSSHASIDKGNNSIIDQRDICIEASTELEHLWAPSCESVLITNFEVSYHVNLWLKTLNESKNEKWSKIVEELNKKTLFEMEAKDRADIICLMIKILNRSNEKIKKAIDNGFLEITLNKRKIEEFKTKASSLSILGLVDKVIEDGKVQKTVTNIRKVFGENEKVIIKDITMKDDNMIEDEIEYYENILKIYDGDINIDEIGKDILDKMKGRIQEIQNKYEKCLYKKILGYYPRLGKVIFGKDRACRNIYFFSNLSLLLVENVKENVVLPCKHLLNRHANSCPLKNYDLTPRRIFYIKEEWNDFVGSLNKNAYREGNLLKNLKHFVDIIGDIVKKDNGNIIERLGLHTWNEEYNEVDVKPHVSEMIRNEIMQLIDDIISYKAVRYTRHLKEWKDCYNKNNVKMEEFIYNIQEYSCKEKYLLDMIVPFVMILLEKIRETESEELLPRSEPDITVEEMKNWHNRIIKLTNPFELLKIIKMFKIAIDLDRRIIFQRCFICKNRYFHSLRLHRCRCCKKTYHSRCQKLMYVDNFTMYCDTCLSSEDVTKKITKDHLDNLHVFITGNETNENGPVKPPYLTYEAETTINDTIVSLFRNPIAADFVHSVNSLYVRDYYDIIKKPVDLTSVIHHKLKLRIYQNMQEIMDDVAQMCDNAIIYNGVGHIVAEKGRKIENYLFTVMSRLV
ncbi:Bromodomain and Zinc finger, FYVE/PHD-type domain and WSTF/Acf1/Cbp146 domain-containing protein [Strongyloides ratti]|uniref:Bromodomain and Zinc finger, FYVE/PHD-type domain and WSTF/Acf1/Cbp146 domain-containing protein n=1 Tax=Strongyloides ratti TaxID=34506 RepID=A0A090LKF8_STRRB|nr:Bromodomain and Zinc finger, FYVE/PHD-type domain and WSTF/Acf1/Cbp146 domain-containing protein [Strongyloides ratti]CEF68633.1 Bromodomain and Zinc finger, FYVE/PHD-type domain and WSTF/Acf1/Cbp146 domain-containing protein [Strongyloides ratti]